MDELRFEGRTAIITGAGGGLGRAYALLLASRGAAVIVNDVNDPGATVAEIKASGGIAVSHCSSVNDEQAVTSMVELAQQEFGGLDILVNNAGIVRDKAVHNMTTEMFDDVVAVHLRGTFLLSQAAYRLMREQRYGRIIVTTSSAGLYGNFGQANYSAAKMAVIGLARTLAHEGRSHGILVNAIAPGALTPMTAHVAGENGARMSPDLVAPVIAYLSHESCELSGEVLSAVAGRVARCFLAETVGFYDNALTPELIADNLGTVLSEQGYLVPTDIGVSMALIPPLI